MATTTKIDVHAHYFPPVYGKMLERHGMGERIDGAPRPAWSEERQLAFMDDMGIEVAVLSLSSPAVNQGDDAEAIEVARGSNEYGADLARRHPGRFVAAGTLPVPDAEGAIAEIRHCREKLGIRSFAMLTQSCGVYLGSPELEPVMEELDRQPCTVVLHPTCPARVPDSPAAALPDAFMEYFFDTTRAIVSMIVAGTFRKHPNIRFVVPHAGAVLPVLSDRLAVLSRAFPAGELDVMGDLAGLYYDLAGVSMPKQFDLVRQVTDDSHILYGSDAPFTPPALCGIFAAAMDQRFDDGLATAIFRENALAIFPEIQDQANTNANTKETL